MNHKLINYIGIDYKNQISKWQKSFKLESFLSFSENINDLLSFSVFKNEISYKTLDFFESSNFSEEGFFGNLIIIKNSFELIFEFSTKENISKIASKSFFIKNANHISLDNFFNSNLDIKVFVSDLFCFLEETNKVSFCINLTYCIDEL